MSPFELSSCCSCHVFAVISPSSYPLETSEMSAIFVFTTKTTKPRSQVFSVNGALTRKKDAFLMAKFFQIWSSVAGYGELCVCF